MYTPEADGALGGQLEVRRFLSEGDRHAGGAVQVSELLKSFLEGGREGVENKLKGAFAAAKLAVMQQRNVEPLFFRKSSPLSRKKTKFLSQGSIINRV